ncbi:MAG: IucA/IucC family protein [Bdellovibrio sp.]
MNQFNKILLINIFTVLATVCVWAESPKKIDGSENLSYGVKEMLYDEQVLNNKYLWKEGTFSSNIDPNYIPEARAKFPLPYYLLPQEMCQFLQADSLSANVLNQLKVTIDGKVFFKLFVHPESEQHYNFLKTKIQYVDSEHTEFTASPTSSYRSLLVWNQNSKNTVPFIAKVSLDRNVIGSIDRLVSADEVRRSISHQRAFDKMGQEKLKSLGVGLYPETAGLLVSKKEFKDAPSKVGGQIIREIPDDVLSGTNKILSLSSVMSHYRENHPYFVDMVEKSGLSATEFIRKIFINDYMITFEKVTFKNGRVFEPHSQNLSIDISSDFAFKEWIIKDFGGIWTDYFTIIANGDSSAAEYNTSQSAAVNKFEGGRSNAIGSYINFYRRQVFLKLMEEMEKYYKELTPNVQTALLKELDTHFNELVKKYFNFNGPEITVDTVSYYQKKIAQQTYFNFNNNSKFTEISINNSLKKWIRTKSINNEWVKLHADTVSHTDRLFISEHGAILVENNGLVKGFGAFNEEDLINEKLFPVTKNNNRFKENLCPQIFGL